MQSPAPFGLEEEIEVDDFAGGGGASTGMEQALGRSPAVAINHDAVALAMHEVNHPQTVHLTSDIWKVDPRQATGGRPVGLLWASPDCKHFSKAKGGKPRDKNIRGLAWVVVHWANVVSPRVIILENVEEFQDWGPLGDDDQPCPLRKGETFARWVGQFERLGYAVEWKELRACDYGAPTIRKRLFLIARRDGRAIVWPEPTHGDPASEAVRAGRLKPWRAAAEIIDWSLPCPSIFDSAEEIRAKLGLRANRPLQPATMARLAKGVKRYVLDTAEPFIVSLTHQGGERAQGVAQPIATLTGAHRGEKALVAPLISHAQQGGRSRPADAPLHTVTASRKDQNQVAAVHLSVMRNADKPQQGADQPAHTITAGGAHMTVAAAFLAQNNYAEPGHDAREPMSTVVAKGSTQSLLLASLSHQYGSGGGEGDPSMPARAVTAEGQHHAVVAAYLQKYYGADQDPGVSEPLHTATTKARFGLAQALLDLPPFTDAHAARARQVADFLRAHGAWDAREFVTVEIAGHTCVIIDLGMRMFVPSELFAAQGFPSGYVIDRRPDGSPISKTEQISKCGNSVSPPVARALVAANYKPELAARLPEMMEAAE
ncbi:DNA cytosine methyltransferase [Bradyrhizobium sp. SRS-191]|uniref:DNA cytosine methyltransferase n=1 Tax=Bradyrhizobium sp. SRS-191 TaxID=2962606 RepID=UPI00211E9CE0|nr:DNA cytosine methyltransferase [Bradyrhizobium sp. SRS-191]